MRSISDVLKERSVTGQPNDSMSKHWHGTGGLFGPTWSILHRKGRFTLKVDQNEEAFQLDDLHKIEIVHRWGMFHYLIVKNSQKRRYRGLKRQDANSLSACLRFHQHRHSVAQLIQKTVEWVQLARSTVGSHTDQRRWITGETLNKLLESQPRAPKLSPEMWDVMSEDERESVRLLNADLEKWVADTNEWILEQELSEHAEFFENIENNPLTSEQARAVVCFDNRVQLVASAGSGKTSVMVARAAYAVLRGFVSPKNILLLAFNKAAAKELDERIRKRFEKVGLRSEGIRASTFHSFGLSIIGQARGAKPRLASWAEPGADLEALDHIVNQLCADFEHFRFHWEMFHLLYSDLGESTDETDGDWFDFRNNRRGFRTYQGETVNSQGEQFIANWLYMNHVDYEYEKPYAHNVATIEYSQYHPDFYYPVIDTWHEHWAVDATGNPPDSFKGYKQQMLWKKELHKKHGTNLMETTWAEILDGSIVTKLKHELTDRGLNLWWDPSRETQGSKPVEREQILKLIRTFMTHQKSNAVPVSDLKQRLATTRDGLKSFRTRLFLYIYEHIETEWNRRLASEGSVDFDDMLTDAITTLEEGEVVPSYDLVLVDEFQDTSYARARLVKALVNPPEKFLLTVGDDWQAINRFAGADLSIMTSFGDFFGQHQQLYLTRTHRSTQIIADTARDFVLKNPAQMNKEVHAQQAGTYRIQLKQANSRDNVASVVRETLEDLNRLSSSHAVSKKSPIEVLVLGRYKKGRETVPHTKYENINVRYSTIHGAKGGEADYVIVVNLVHGSSGFPNLLTDDPVLELIMPDPDPFTHAEERRLMYVALTRAKKQVVLIGVENELSPFVVELIGDNALEQGGSIGLETKVCVLCKKGTLVTVNGRKGKFHRCSRFPKCLHTQNSFSAHSGPSCPSCANGFLVLRYGRYGKFFGCTKFPECRHTQNLISS